MNKKKNQKKGWTLIELCVALIALAILVGLSIQSIKPKKFLIGPFAYAGYYNIKQATVAVMNKCTQHGGDGIYGCQTGAYKLPVTDEAAIIAINSAIDKYNNSITTGATPDPHVTINDVDEILCMEVGNMFTLLDNSPIHCKYNNGSGDGTKLPTGDGKGGNAGVPNFQTSNMVAYYFLERPWFKINRAAPEEQRLQMATESLFKPIFIDVNGNKEPNKLGEDQFPLRLYIDGTITPGSCSLYPGSSDVSADDVGEAVDSPGPNGENYPTNLYCPSRSVSVGGEETPIEITTSWLESNYPFSYNLVHSYIPEGATSAEREAKIILRNITYQQAACKSGRSIVVPRVTFCGEDGTNKESQNHNANNLLMLEDCTTGTTSSVCFERIARPANPGLFRLPLM